MFEESQNAPLRSLHAGLPWSVKLADDSGTIEQRKARVAMMAMNRAWFAAADGQFERCPDLAEWANEANPACAVGMSRNGWACFVNGSAYWHSHSELKEDIDACDGWLRNVDGEMIETKWELRLFDVRHPGVRTAFVHQTQRLMFDHGATFLFLDECYDDRWPSVKAGHSVKDPLPIYGSLGWNDSMRWILRNIRKRVVINGPFDLDLSAMIDGIYIQNAHTKSNTEDRLQDSVTRGFHRTCIQVPVAESMKWQRIVAKYPGCTIQEIPTPPPLQFDFPPPSVILQG